MRSCGNAIAHNKLGVHVTTEKHSYHSLNASSNDSYLEDATDHDQKTMPIGGRIVQQPRNQYELRCSPRVSATSIDTVEEERDDSNERQSLLGLRSTPEKVRAMEEEYEWE